MVKNEVEFYQDLKNIFIGAKVEGNSGFVNLMRIKSAYFDKIFKLIQSDIDAKISEFPEFKEELFTRLHTFFKTYFSESGSIYFSYTPLKSKVYEKIYTNIQDVVLFWKTNMLYYVKTDNLWKSLSINYKIDNLEYKVVFDASQIEGKRANEKGEVVFELDKPDKIEDKVINFKSSYLVGGKKTKVSEILKGLNKTGIHITEEQLEELFHTFKKQTEVDYFINKDAKTFLREQFDLWLKNYIFDDDSVYSETRIKQLKILKNIAYNVIDFVSQFEDELVKTWNKPKFVLNSNYVITLDRIAEKDIEIINKILNNNGIDDQISEWKDLHLVDDNFNKNNIINMLDKSLNPDYKFLPVDTKYFKDIEFNIIKLFDDLDNELDGRLIHSENYQALNTILPKFKDKIQTIYIDPPFNKDKNADYLYNVKYKDATWITLLENRIRLAKDYLNEEGSIFVRCDYNGNMYVRLLMNDIFGGENFRNEMVVNRTQEFFKFSHGLNKFMVDTDTLFFYGKAGKSIFNEIKIKREIEKWWEPFLPGNPKDKDDCYRIVFKQKFPAPKGRKWGFSQDQIEELEQEDRIKIENGKIKYAPLGTTLKNNWTDIPGYSRHFDFPTENSEILLKRVIESTSNESDLVMDFFLGSGTTAAVAHKLKRKWIGIEMGEHFYDVVLPRMKKVLAYDKSGISKENDVKEKYNEKNAGGFFKYFNLEQYEQTLKNSVYLPSEPLYNLNDTSIYNQYVFFKDLKFLDKMEIDNKNNKIKFNFNGLYDNIDIAETLSLVKGKFIKSISKDEVVFNDAKIVFSDVDFTALKPLIWW
ncbi:hypothetical protein FAD_1325 [Ferroplasma acidiphilum]|uniref:DNA methylase N-4/N-6 domain-containing protein n=1 Tax=Ferroplasma acidiphilum TaxID=74969 RepID=A0A1V0N523_9ARCH|nr:site-specific DNA-methyltransferase [Ferroplasma acidiphilum]ARD85189.1 hypothetical protein FAD_1325 [Ferroplasma acidiphilum]